jgi:hypothetical protein
VILATHGTDIAIAIGTALAAGGALLTFAIAAWTMWVNLYDRRRALIDALGAWFEGDDAHGPHATLRSKLHIKNAGPTPMRGVYVLAEAVLRADDGFTAEPYDSVVFPINLGRTIAPKVHCVKDISLEPTSENKVLDDARIGLRVKEVVARDNSGRIWRVNKSLRKRSRAKSIKYGGADVVLNWNSSKRFIGYKQPIEGPTETIHD